FSLGDAGEAASSLRLTGALWPYWEMRGHITEGRGYIRAALGQPAPADVAIRAQALFGGAFLAYVQGRRAETVPLAQDCLDLSWQANDLATAAEALLHLGHVALVEGHPAQAEGLLAECVSACQAADWNTGGGVALVDLGLLARS